MILRNTAGQSITLGPLLDAAGAAQTSGAALFVAKDGVNQGAGAGTLTHWRSGVWFYAPTQGETDCGQLSLSLEKSGSTTVALTVLTTRLPVQTATDAAAGLPTAATLWKAAMRAPAVVHVNGATGNDATGDGSYAAPYATMGKANGIGVTPVGGTILVWPGTYAESNESLDTREWYLMRGAVAVGAPALWVDTNRVSVRGDGTFRCQSAAGVALLLTDGYTDVRGVTFELGHATARAVDHNGAGVGQLFDVRVDGGNGGTDPAGYFSGDGPVQNLGLFQTSVTVQSRASSVQVGYGYPGLWSTATGLGDVGAVYGDVSGDVAGKVLGGGAGTITGDGAQATHSAAERAAVADKILGRSIAGGADGGRTVQDALRAARNKVVFDVPGAGQFTVYREDDVTPAWTGTYTRAAVNTLVGVDPA